MRNLITGNKTEAQIQAMREGGKILARILRELTEFSKVRMTGLEVDAFARKKIKEYDPVDFCFLEDPSSAVVEQGLIFIRGVLFLPLAS